MRYLFLSCLLLNSCSFLENADIKKYLQNPSGFRIAHNKDTEILAKGSIDPFQKNIDVRIIITINTKF